MNRLDPVILELEAARATAIAQFAAEANMPVPDFQRHFRVIALFGVLQRSGHLLDGRDQPDRNALEEQRRYGVVAAALGLQDFRPVVDL